MARIVTMAKEQQQIEISFSFDKKPEAIKLNRLLIAKKNCSDPIAEQRLKYQSKVEGNIVTIKGDFTAIHGVLSSLANAMYPRPQEQLITQNIFQQFERQWNELNLATYNNNNSMFNNQNNSPAELTTHQTVQVGGPSKASFS